MTNTSELAAKNGWSFTDTLPAGLTLASPASAVSNCPNSVITATAGATSVGLSGDLAGGMVSCTFTVNVTSNTVGSFTNGPNNVTVHGLNDPGTSTVTFVSNPSITLDKSADKTELVAGETITYSFSSTNTGNVTLTEVAITDPLTGLSSLTYTWPGTPGTLLAGQTVTAMATYVVTQADVDAGLITNTADVLGNPPIGPPVTDTDNVQVPSTPAPGQSITKTADSSAITTPAQVGQVITYNFTSQNTGNVTLTNVSIADQLAGLSPLVYTWPGTAGTLLPGQTVTATATYAITQADIDAGHVVNSALSSGDTPPGNPPVPPVPPATTDTPIPSTPGISLEKTADKTTLVAGETITYTFTSQNTGNVTLTGVAITDPLTGLSALTYTWPGTAGTLLPGQTVTATATYVVTQADVDAGTVSNTATVTGTPPTGPAVTGTDTVTVPATQTPGQSITKTADSSAITNPAQVGQIITYTFTSQNTGNVTLTNVAIVDQLQGLSALTYTWPGTAGTLLPGQTVTATATYAITQTDIDAGQVTNSALPTGDVPPGVPPVTPPPPATVIVELPSVPAVTVPTPTPPAPVPADPGSLAYTGAWMFGLPLGLALLFGGGIFLIATKRRPSQH